MKSLQQRWIDKLIGIIKGKEEAQVNTITDAKLEDMNFIARSNFNLAWIIQNYSSKNIYI